MSGKYLRLEPLALCHVDSLVKAAATDTTLYQWSSVPKTTDETVAYIQTALAWAAAQSAVPFAIVRQEDGVVIGSTRFWNIEYWAWPQGHPFQGRGHPDACEIGYTWLTHAAIRTAANKEIKTLMLTHAFDTWNVLRVCLHTDVRNVRSRSAIERIGGHFEGVPRSHRLAADATPRDSARYSILSSEWPRVKSSLEELLNRRQMSG